MWILAPKVGSIFEKYTYSKGAEAFSYTIRWRLGFVEVASATKPDLSIYFKNDEMVEDANAWWNDEREFHMDWLEESSLAAETGIEYRNHEFFSPRLVEVINDTSETDASIQDLVNAGQFEEHGWILTRRSTYFTGPVEVSPKGATESGAARMVAKRRYRGSVFSEREWQTLMFGFGWVAMRPGMPASGLDSATQAKMLAILQRLAEAKYEYSDVFKDMDLFRGMCYDLALVRELATCLLGEMGFDGYLATMRADKRSAVEGVTELIIILRKRLWKEDGWYSLEYLRFLRDLASELQTVRRVVQEILKLPTVLNSVSQERSVHYRGGYDVPTEIGWMAAYAAFSFMWVGDHSGEVNGKTPGKATTLALRKVKQIVDSEKETGNASHGSSGEAPSRAALFIAAHDFIFQGRDDFLEWYAFDGYLNDMGLSSYDGLRIFGGNLHEFSIFRGEMAIEQSQFFLDGLVQVGEAIVAGCGLPGDAKQDLLHYAKAIRSYFAALHESGDNVSPMASPVADSVDEGASRQTLSDGHLIAPHLPCRIDAITGRPVLPDGYRPSADEEYMSELQLEYFRRKLMLRLGDQAERRVQEIKELEDQLRDVADGAEHPASEPSAALELRERILKERRNLERVFANHRNRLIRIDEGSYGYCVDTYEEIGLDRLDALPIAQRTIEAQEIWEKREALWESGGN